MGKLGFRSVRIFLNIMIVISTSILVGILAFDNLSGSENKELLEIFLQIMHIGFLAGAILNLIHFTKGRKYSYILLTALPIVLFLIAIIGMAYGFGFSNLSLVVFDFYLIFWFFFLSIREIEDIKTIKKLKVDD